MLYLTLLQGVQGTGQGGRVVSRDVLSRQPAVTPHVVPGASYTDMELSSMRKVRRRGWNWEGKDREGRSKERNGKEKGGGKWREEREE